MAGAVRKKKTKILCPECEKEKYLRQTGEAKERGSADWAFPIATWLAKLKNSVDASGKVEWQTCRRHMAKFLGRKREGRVK